MSHIVHHDVKKLFSMPYSYDYNIYYCVVKLSYMSTLYLPILFVKSMLNNYCIMYFTNNICFIKNRIVVTYVLG